VDKTETDWFREAVTAAFGRSAGLRDWDAMQLQMYIVSSTPRPRRSDSNLTWSDLQDQGTFLDSDSKVRLKTPKEQEAVCFRQRAMVTRG
jgi:hypothetical protein